MRVEKNQEACFDVGLLLVIGGTSAEIIAFPSRMFITGFRSREILFLVYETVTRVSRRKWNVVWNFVNEGWTIR